MVLRREILQLFKYANISVVLRSGFIFAMQSVLTESTTKVYFLGDGGFLGDRKTRTWKCVCGRERYRHRKRRASIIDGIMNGIGGIVGGIFGKPLEVEPHIVGGLDILPVRFLHIKSLIIDNDLYYSFLKNIYPWMVLYLQAGVSPCGGALVASKYVVTAAHCLYFDVDSNIPKVPSDIKITLGEHDRSIKEEGILKEKTVGVAKIFRHEDYDPKNMFNDIAVLELSEDVDLETYTPVCLPKSSDTNVFYGTVAEAYGWGTTEFMGQVSDKLLTVRLPVVDPSNSDCQKSMIELHDGKICAGGKKGKDACQVAVEDQILNTL